MVSPETHAVAKEINQLRKAKSWVELEIFLVPWVNAADHKPIHSARIRSGEIDQNGELFSIPNTWGLRKLSESLRQQLKKPLGLLLRDKTHDHKAAAVTFKQKFWHSLYLTVSVGDAVTDSLLKQGITPNISIIDLHINRHQVYEKIGDLGFRDIKLIKNAKNPAGTLSFDVFKILDSLIHGEAESSVLQIDGEEDLLTLFAILCAPLQSRVLYGQPNEGVVVVFITEEKKQEIKKLLDQFII